MEKKYQVFISSTYTDLIEERREVMEVLLQMNCFPVGMEYFNASDESQWEIIKKLIDDCDYYILIVAGRYGSVDKNTGKSYTQMEFDYAVSQGKTVLRFVHDKLDELKACNVESTDEGKRKLDTFRADVMKKYCKMWNTTKDLKAQVVLALSNQFNTNPQVGWIKANQTSSDEANKEILRLRQEIDSLKSKISNFEENAPQGTELLAQGEDLYSIHFDCEDVNYNEYENITQQFSWNQIFGYLAPYMVVECVEHALENHFKEFVAIHMDPNFKRVQRIKNQHFQEIKIQFIALGLIQESKRKKSASNSLIYWSLTPYGHRVLMQLKAIKKKRIE